MIKPIAEIKLKELKVAGWRDSKGFACYLAKEEKWGPSEPSSGSKVPFYDPHELVAWWRALGRADKKLLREEFAAFLENTASAREETDEEKTAKGRTAALWWSPDEPGLGSGWVLIVRNGLLVEITPYLIEHVKTYFFPDIPEVCDGLARIQADAILGIALTDYWSWEECEEDGVEWYFGAYGAPHPYKTHL